MLDSIYQVATAPFAVEIVKMIDNGRNYGALIGGSLISLLGVILIIYGAFCAFQAVKAQQGGAGSYWMKFALSIVLGGAMLYGGFNLFARTLAGGMDGTIKKFGDNTGVTDVKKDTDKELDY